MADLTVASDVDSFMAAANKAAMLAVLNITLGGAFATSGSFTTTLTVTGNTNVTLPTSGTLAILGANAFGGIQTITTTSLGGTTIYPYLCIENTSAAISGTQQFSPAIKWRGQEYTTGSGSVTVNYYAWVKTIQYVGSLPIGGGYPALAYFQIYGDVNGAQSNVRSVYNGYNDLKLDLHGTLWLNPYSGRAICIGSTPEAGTTSIAIDSSNGLSLVQSHSITWCNGFNAFATPDYYLLRFGTNHALFTDYTTASMALSVSNTHTSSTSYEFLTFDWAANVARVGTHKGSGGGTARAMAIVTDGTARINIGASGEIGFFGATAIAKPTVSGSRAVTEQALANLLTELDNLGLITNSTSV